MAKRKRSAVATMPKLRDLNDEQIQAITDLMNDLRGQGLDKVINIPSTIVVGDTSSGKSSVMSRLTGLEFPRGEGVVTCFVTEVDMKPHDETSITFAVLSTGPNGTQHREEIDSDSIEQAFAGGIEKMRDRSPQKLKRDVLRIEIRGPKYAPLTVIDLPGLMQAKVTGVTDQDIALSEELIEKYVKNPRTIVLAVVSAANDVVNQKITEISRRFDPKGLRTLGILTKVDTVSGKANDQRLMEVLSNEKVCLELGWHALVNTIEDEEDASEDDIAAFEKKFFDKPRFSRIDKNCTGIGALLPRIQKVVGTKLNEELPAVEADVKASLEKAAESLRGLGDPRADRDEQVAFLTKLADDFESDMDCELDLSKAYLSSRGDASEVRLIADVNDLQSQFSKAMLHFASPIRFATNPMLVVGVPQSNFYYSWVSSAKTKSHFEAVEWVLRQQKAYGDGGFPALMDPQVSVNLFLELSQRWESLTEQHIKTLRNKCEELVVKMLKRTTVNAPDVIENLTKKWIQPHLADQVKMARDTLAELVEKKTPLIMITTDRHKHLMSAHYDAVATKRYPSSTGGFEPSNLEQSIALSTLCGVRAYYEVRLDKWIADVGQEIVDVFVRSLPDILNGERVKEASPAEIKALVSEPKDVIRKRETLIKKIAMLERALKKIKKQKKGLEREVW